MATNELKRQLPRLLLAVAAVGCTAPQGESPASQANSPAPAANQAAPVDETTAARVALRNAFHGLGTEPFWGVSVGDGRLIYDAMDGEDVSVAAPRRAETPGGYRWQTPRITVAVTHEACSDGMSMNVYPGDMKVTVDGRELLGCGGYDYRDDLAGSRWQIVNVTFEEVAGEAYRLEFTENRVSGRAGCNRFSGSYRRTGDNELEFGPIAVTRMACPEPQMEHERAALEIFTTKARLIYSRPGTVALTNELGGLLLQPLP